MNNRRMEGKIRKAQLPAALPILSIPKPYGYLSLWVDDRRLNKITVKNRYPVPRTDELPDKLGKGKIFTKFYLKNGFHLLRLRGGDEWKTAVRTGYGLYEYLVIPFGLCNATSAFQALINPVTFTVAL